MTSQLEKQRKWAITAITRRNSIKAPGQVCEGGVIDMWDLEINCVGHSEAMPTHIEHNAISGIRVWLKWCLQSHCSYPFLLKAKDFVLPMASVREHFFVKKRNQGWMIRSLKVVPPKRVPIPCPVTGLAALSPGAPGGEERPDPWEGGPSLLQQSVWWAFDPRTST